MLPSWLQKKIVEVDGCWVWQGWTDRHGYGYTGRGAIHRIAYEALRGPIPEGLVLDHLCRVKTCCNPDHLEPVTLAENIRRGQEARGAGAYATHCKAGHAFDEKNTYRYRGGRHCRACNVQRVMAYQGRKVAS